MKDAVDYLYHIKANVLGNPDVVNIDIVREEAIDELGLYRFRLKLTEDSLLEMYEHFSVQEDNVQVLKYSFYWQNSEGELKIRWDNAAHHLEILTHPHQVHEGSDNSILPGEPMNAEKVLLLIDARISG